MEKRKRMDQSHWVTPGVFSGSYTVEEAVERITSTKQMESINHTTDDSVWKERLELLESRLTELTHTLSSMEKHWKSMEEENKKERQHLYHVVLSLKKEWEKERDAHRHN
ncbi:hypothetical protein [Brevibacillus sp. H7]|uniref:hypothetical protein n=1 Tax=Brevibacillus sp. H7 TaxID=3349138 RepID=UPI0037FEC27C